MKLLEAAPKKWRVAELDRLPDDGHRYEVVEGELFVTPVKPLVIDLPALFTEVLG